MIHTEEQIKGGANAKKSMIQEQEDITSNIKTYLSRADQFAVRMSTAVTKSMAGKKSLVAEQNALFVDHDNVQLNKDQHHGHGHKAEKKEGCNLTPFVLMIALSMHAMFEGIALGLMSDIG